MKSFGHLAVSELQFWAHSKQMQNTMGSRPRCVGHCCRGFAIERSLDEVWEDYERWKVDPASSVIPDVHVIAPMLIPIKELKGEWLFTCKHLSKSGDCTIYEQRPQMCRDFPGSVPCPYPICASHGERGLLRKVWDWVRT